MVVTDDSRDIDQLGLLVMTRSPLMTVNRVSASMLDIGAVDGLPPHSSVLTHSRSLDPIHRCSPHSRQLRRHRSIRRTPSRDRQHRTRRRRCSSPAHTPQSSLTLPSAHSTRTRRLRRR